jgi:hypothetical protein
MSRVLRPLKTRVPGSLTSRAPLSDFACQTQNAAFSRSVQTTFRPASGLILALWQAGIREARILASNLPRVRTREVGRTQQRVARGACVAARGGSGVGGGERAPEAPAVPLHHDSIAGGETLD